MIEWEPFLFFMYLVGFFTDWTYWIAVGLDPAQPLASGVFGGVFIAMVWPLHVGMELWKWLLA